MKRYTVRLTDFLTKDYLEYHEPVLFTSLQKIITDHLATGRYDLKIYEIS